MYKKILAGWACIAWALWFGGLVALGLFVMRLFAADRELAIKTAPQLFSVFGRYQILLAAFALLATAGWRFSVKSGRISVLFFLLAFAALAAAVGPAVFMNRMMELWSHGDSASTEFQKLHHVSEIVYSAQILILLVTGLLFPWAFRQPDN